MLTHIICKFTEEFVFKSAEASCINITRVLQQPFKKYNSNFLEELPWETETEEGGCRALLPQGSLIYNFVIHYGMFHCSDSYVQFSLTQMLWLCTKYTKSGSRSLLTVNTL